MTQEYQFPGYHSDKSTRDFSCTYSQNYVVDSFQNVKTGPDNWSQTQTVNSFLMEESFNLPLTVNVIY